jgi:hypothetical protein
MAHWGRTQLWHAHLTLDSRAGRACHFQTAVNGITNLQAAHFNIVNGFAQAGLLPLKIASPCNSFVTVARERGHFFSLSAQREKPSKVIVFVSLSVLRPLADRMSALHRYR